jgi:uncharacterized membrane protein
MVKPLAEWSAALVESVGIGLIVFFSLYAMAYGLWGIVRRRPAASLFTAVRQRLGQGILLGLEFLIAADIIHTVAVELNFNTVGVLAIVVLIRTFLSFTLQLELTGSWPWQSGGHEETSGERPRGSARLYNQKGPSIRPDDASPDNS